MARAQGQAIKWRLRARRVVEGPMLPVLRVLLEAISKILGQLGNVQSAVGTDIPSG